MILAWRFICECLSAGRIVFESIMFKIACIECDEKHRIYMLISGIRACTTIADCDGFISTPRNSS